VRERLRVVRRIRAALAEHAAGLAQASAISSQRPVAESIAGEVLPLADACRFLEKRADRILGPQRAGAGRPAWLRGIEPIIRREPHGVVLIIGPSNYPLFLPGVQAVQALIAGNAVVVKPGAGGGAAALAFAEICRLAGLPARLLHVLPETRAAAAAAIEAGVDKVVLTGSAETGRAVLQSLAPKLIPATMELSGSDAMIVRGDADLALVTRAISFGLRWNAGATCIAPRRVFVHESLAEALEAKLRRAIDALPPVLLSGPLNEQVLAVMRDAVLHGSRIHAKVSAEGIPCVPAVVVAGTPALLTKRAPFAPILSLTSVRDDAEAVALANDCDYALGASIFTADASAGKVLAAHLRAGVVTVNDLIVPTADPRLPFGGRGRSGFGVTRGAEGLLEMTVPKVTIIRSAGRHRHFEPVTPSETPLLTAFVQALHGRGWLRRIRAWLAVMRLAVRSNRTGSDFPSRAPAPVHPISIQSSLTLNPPVHR
jgi:acyl-CoA reductase-like NAD-dependent aldehyde dehydrogenase